MSEIYLVRHGQASLGARNYDQLSDLGVQQSRWLGNYLSQRQIEFSQVLIGGQQRHRQTLDGMISELGAIPTADVDAGLNEFDFQRLLAAFVQRNSDYPQPDGRDVKAVFGTFRVAMKAWVDGSLDDAMDETFEQFSQRVVSAFKTIEQRRPGQRTLVVTSGGPITLILRHIMNFDINAMLGLQIQSRNTALSQLYVGRDSTFVSSINHVPHLDHPQRLSAVTQA